MKIASYNVENLFDRAIALDDSNWAVGKPALSAHRELNELFNKPSYTAANKARMLALFDTHGMLKRDEGPLLLLRKIRGQLIKRPNSGDPSIVASGRDDWTGWVELKTEPVKSTAIENTARVIHAVAPDVLGVVEAEDRTTLRLFNSQVMPQVGGTPFGHVMLIDGNDDRGIDVGIMTGDGYPIRSIRSHVHDTDDDGVIFSRDCAEYEIGLPSGDSLWILVNHMKSKGYGSQASNDTKRLRQAQRVRELVDAHFAAGHTNLAVLGDFNDTPDRPTLAPLLGAASPLHDVSTLAGFDDGGRPGTHGNCTASGRFDYILLSNALFEAAGAAGYERRGMWGGTNGTLWPHFPEVGEEADRASDHAAVWVEIAV
ncbi:MAG: endonuclease/exonuclease/phosphatase family protein [Planctomycetes bacterium]|nr:endonuclease/exonuclease/phosphatase family protein [Planctomycetota bacterium]